MVHICYIFNVVKKLWYDRVILIILIFKKLVILNFVEKEREFKEKIEELGFSAELFFFCWVLNQWSKFILNFYLFYFSYLITIDSVLSKSSAQHWILIQDRDIKTAKKILRVRKLLETDRAMNAKCIYLKKMLFLVLHGV